MRQDQWKAEGQSEDGALTDEGAINYLRRAHKQFLPLGLDEAEDGVA
jgi:hypothetical protein